MNITQTSDMLFLFRPIFGHSDTNATFRYAQLRGFVAHFTGKLFPLWIHVQFSLILYKKCYSE
jgi:hypothetical protein